MAQAFGTTGKESVWFTSSFIVPRFLWIPALGAARWPRAGWWIYLAMIGVTVGLCCHDPNLKNFPFAVPLNCIIQSRIAFIGLFLLGANLLLDRARHRTIPTAQTIPLHHTIFRSPLHERLTVIVSGAVGGWICTIFVLFLLWLLGSVGDYDASIWANLVTILGWATLYGIPIGIIIFAWGYWAFLRSGLTRSNLVREFFYVILSGLFGGLLGGMLAITPALLLGAVFFFACCAYVQAMRRDIPVNG